MRLIEPCCAPRHFMFLRDAIGQNGKTKFHGYGDLSLTEMLPAILTRYSETTMMIVAPSIPDQAADIISRWLRKQWARMDGRGKINCLSKLTIIAGLSAAKSPIASEWLKNNPFGSRLELINRAQDDTALLLPDIAITGPMNFTYDKEFVCNVTTMPDEVNDLWAHYTQLMRKRNTKKKAKKDSASSTDDSASSTDSTTYVETDSASSTDSTTYIEPESASVKVSAGETESVQEILSESSTDKETED